MNTQIHIEGEGWSGAHSWLDFNADLILTDPANNLVYQAHQYFDRYNEGRYDNGYDPEGAYAMVGVDRLKPFVEWLAANGLKGFLGDSECPAVIRRRGRQLRVRYRARPNHRTWT
jgi:endoglucanase